ncbi:SRPBCC family protein [Sinomonas sp. P10A9]|uniref:SRPBCC family protein n=1 Tax=Sinomonas puerhi TaxID=3238584 RepID=A0AB39L6G1_9MICC
MNLSIEEDVMGHIKVSMPIDAPVERVYEIASDPHRWSSWWVNLGDAEKVEGDGGEGTVVEHKYLMAGFPFHVTTHVLENGPLPNGGKRIRLRFDGPLNGSQVWDYEPTDTGTLVTSEIDYNVPGSVVGKFADELLIERIQERARHQGLENLKLLVEAG